MVVSRCDSIVGDGEWVCNVCKHNVRNVSSTELGSVLRAVRNASQVQDSGGRCKYSALKC